MIDVHAIADRPLSFPVLSWSVREVGTGQLLGTIRREGASVVGHRAVGGRYLSTAVTGERSVHQELAGARDAVALAFTPRSLVA